MSVQRTTASPVTVKPPRHVPADEPSLAVRLSDAFGKRPLADGEEHPADDIIASFLDSAASKTYPSELESIILQSENVDLVASTLQCVARFEAPWADWRKTDLVRSALQSNDVCIRDAAVRAAESWLCPDMLTVLEEHRDAEPWLQEYIREVIADAG